LNVITINPKQYDPLALAGMAALILALLMGDRTVKKDKQGRTNA
jgi:hypothetical protein